jgi:uncharacterized membrane protein YuzA (DUF378 family)
MAAAPVLIPDYIFMWAFLLSFSGAVFYSFIGLLNIDIASIIVSKNMTMILNVIIGISGVISIFVWFNMDIPALDNNILNSKVVKSNINA